MPGAWIVGFPALIIYATVRAYLFRRRDPARFNAAIEPYAVEIRRLRRNLGETTAQSITEYCLNNPIHITKLIAAFFIIFGWNMPFSFFAVYGLFRFTNQEWLEIFQDKINSFYNIVSGILNGINRVLPFSIKLAAFITGCVLTGIFINSIGLSLVLINFVDFPLQMCATTVGFTALARDVSYMLRNPIRAFTNNPGKFYGLVWGRWLSFLLFPGRVVGSMGPASGHVDSAGVFTSVFGWLFPADHTQGWFTFGSTLTGWLGGKLFSFINSIFTSVFFSYNMRLQGDFYGVLGPTSFQIFACMSIGCFIGYCFEGLANRIYSVGAYDALENAEVVGPRLNRMVNYLYQYRWQIGFVAAITPFVLASPGGAVFIDLAYGSTALGAGLAGLTGVGAMGVTHGVFAGVRALFNRVFHRSAAQPPLPVVNIIHEPIPDLPLLPLNEPVPVVAIHHEPEPVAAVFTPAFIDAQAEGEAEVETEQAPAPAEPVVEAIPLPAPT